LRRIPFLPADTKTAITILYDDYGILSGIKHYKDEINRLKKIASLYNIIMRLKTAIYINDKKLIQKLTGTQNITTAEGALKNWIFEYEQLTNNKTETETKTDSNTIETTLVEISKHMGYRIDTKIVTVSEFASMIKSYNREIEHQKQTLKALKP
jgi:hypothetical protein